jgi:hypothetical protein
MNQLAKMILISLTCGFLLMPAALGAVIGLEAGAARSRTGTERPLIVAQTAGGEGGTIGKNDKSVSGRETERKSRSIRRDSNRHEESRPPRKARTQGFARHAGSSERPPMQRSHCVSGSFAGYSGHLCY